ncbi:C39 family peptidase [Aquibacillus kalidii]|uniref:C39 family peptidase n=1 Tax=Aquibacillus kalidii TaxID=2762597 RepID=UPI001F2BE2BD|nr:C39 family peptidase [Aquibacillus kalidii]
MSKYVGDSQQDTEAIAVANTMEEETTYQMDYEQSLMQNDIELYIEFNKLEEEIILYKEQYYIPLSNLSNIVKGNIMINPLIDMVTVFHEEQAFYLSIHRPSELFSMDDLLNKTKDTKTERNYIVLELKQNLFIPLSFIQDNTDYLVETDKREGVKTITIYRKAQFPLDVPLINQMASPRLYNGCEITSLAMLLQFHGLDVTKNELANELRYVPMTYASGLKGNPNEGFVGDIVDGPGLGVNHGPVYDVAKDHVGERALNLTGSNLEELYYYLDQGLPVWVIINTAYAPVSDIQTWQTPTGEVDITFSVHSVVLTGYDKGTVSLNDPYGTKNREVKRENFEDAWKQMGSQAIVVTR